MYGKAHFFRHFLQLFPIDGSLFDGFLQARSKGNLRQGPGRSLLRSVHQGCWPSPVHIQRHSIEVGNQQMDQLLYLFFRQVYSQTIQLFEKIFYYHPMPKERALDLVAEFIHDLHRCLFPSLRQPDIQFFLAAPMAFLYLL